MPRGIGYGKSSNAKIAKKGGKKKTATITKKHAMKRKKKSGSGNALGGG